MNSDARLQQVAESYRARGFDVVLAPTPDDLPAFAKDFKVEILARRGDSCVLASAKKSRGELEADRQVPRYAEVTGMQPGWRFDLFILGPDVEPSPERRDAQEPTDDQIRRTFGEVERMLQAGFVQQALLTAWAALEGAMRRKLQAAGQRAGWGSSPRAMLNELYSSGELPGNDFRELDRLFQKRTAVVHGFTIPAIDENAVRFLVSAAQRLLDEARLVKKTA